MMLNINKKFLVFSIFLYGFTELQMLLQSGNTSVNALKSTKKICVPRSLFRSAKSHSRRTTSDKRAFTPLQKFLLSRLKHDGGCNPNELFLSYNSRRVNTLSKARSYTARRTDERRRGVRKPADVPGRDIMAAGWRSVKSRF